ncbi:MAG: type II toxin-antitoxin system RelE/ParE family toxin [Pseudomonadota bacterium]
MFRVKLTPAAAERFSSLHPDIRKQLKPALKELYHTPCLGKGLHHELMGFRTLKVKRYRIVYKIDDIGRTVIVYAIGHRRDIYETLTELMRLKEDS